MMTPEQIVNLAKSKELQISKYRQSEVFQKTIGWFCYLGLLRSNFVENRRGKVTLGEVLEVGMVEPRVLELLPAILMECPELIVFKKTQVPKDLLAVIQSIRDEKPLQGFRGIEPQNYLQWVSSEVLQRAKRIADFRKKPRKARDTSTEIGEAIREARIKLCVTQIDLAKTNGVSLKVIRDLEQGKLSASISNVLKVLSSLGMGWKIIS